MMDRKSLLLAALASGGGAAYTPVQVQKLLFLIQKNLPDIVISTDKFDFKPYDYGPFDKEVYAECELLEKEGLLETLTVSGRTWKTYKLSESGCQSGQASLSCLPPSEKKYIQKLSAFVRQLSFSELVSVIYKTYPEMRSNSVFQGS